MTFRGSKLRPLHSRLTPRRRIAREWRRQRRAASGWVKWDASRERRGFAAWFWNELNSLQGIGATALVGAVPSGAHGYSQPRGFSRLVRALGFGR
jgi:hypothetical protein